MDKKPKKIDYNKKIAPPKSDKPIQFDELMSKLLKVKIKPKK